MQAPMLRRVLCYAVAILKILIILEQWNLHFYLVLGPANYGTNPACTTSLSVYVTYFCVVKPGQIFKNAPENHVIRIVERAIITVTMS